MRRLVEFMLSGLPLSPASLHAVNATFADWRHEAACATNRVTRAKVALRSTLALVRALIGSARGELRGVARTPFLWRALIASSFVVLFVGFFEPMFPTEARGAWAFVLMSLAQGLYLGSALLPFAVFAAEVTGRSTRRAPTLGSGMVVAVAVLIWAFIVSPETLNFMWTIHMWGPATEMIPPVPSLLRWLNGQPTKEMSSLFFFNRTLAWITFSVSLWSLAVLAFRLRTFAAGSLGRRVAIVGSALLLGGVLAPTVAILPGITAFGRVPYVWIGLISVLSLAAFCAAASLARMTDARAKALALQVNRS